MNDYDRKRSPRDRRNTLASPRSRVNGLIGKLKNRKSIAVVHGNANKVPFYDMEKIVKNPAYGLSEFSEELIEGGKWVTSNKYHVNPEKIVDFFEKGSEGEKDFKKLKKANPMPRNPILDERIYDPDREKKYRKDNLEKQKRIQEQIQYDKLKEEQKKEQEEKKKELSQNLKRRKYTFSYDANFLFLKPQKEQDILVNDIIEIGFDTKKKPLIKNIEPKEELIPKEAEIIEKETAEDKNAFKTTMKEDKSKEVVGIIKPQPPLKDLIHANEGVVVKLGKGKPIFGGSFKIKGRMSKKQYNKLHKAQPSQGAKKPEISHKEKKKIEEQKEEKEKKKRRTMENWKNEIKKGLMNRGLNFEPDLLIDLIMTEEDTYGYKKKVKKRNERKVKEEKVKQFKKKFKQIAANPEKFLNRMVAFSNEFGNKKRLMRDSKNLANPLFMNKFQKEIQSFNKRIMEKPDEFNTAGDMWAPPQQETTEEMEKRRFKLPKSKSQFIDRNLRNRKKPSTKLINKKNLPLTRGVARVQSSKQLRSKFSIVGNQLRKSEINFRKAKKNKEFMLKSGSQSRLTRSRKSGTVGRLSRNSSAKNKIN